MSRKKIKRRQKLRNTPGKGILKKQQRSRKLFENDAGLSYCNIKITLKERKFLKTTKV